EVYAQILGWLADEGVSWVQLDEPAYVCDRDPAEIAALGRAYVRLSALPHRPRLFVASYFGSFAAALPALLVTDVEAIGLDLVRWRPSVAALREAGPWDGRTVVAGVVDGRNVWRTDLRAALRDVEALRALTDDVVVSSSCSLLHVPVD